MWIIKLTKPSIPYSSKPFIASGYPTLPTISAIRRHWLGYAWLLARSLCHWWWFQFIACRWSRIAHGRLSSLNNWCPGTIRHRGYHGEERLRREAVSCWMLLFSVQILWPRMGRQRGRWWWWWCCYSLLFLNSSNHVHACQENPQSSVVQSLAETASANAPTHVFYCFLLWTRQEHCAEVAKRNLFFPRKNTAGQAFGLESGVRLASERLEPLWHLEWQSSDIESFTLSI